MNSNAYFEIDALEHPIRSWFVWLLAWILGEPPKRLTGLPVEVNGKVIGYMTKEVAGFMNPQTGAFDVVIVPGKLVNFIQCDDQSGIFDPIFVDEGKTRHRFLVRSFKGKNGIKGWAIHNEFGVVLSPCYDSKEALSDWCRQAFPAFGAKIKELL